MKLNLKQFLSGDMQGTKTLDFAGEMDLSHLRRWGESPFADPCRVTGQVCSSAGILTLHYQVDFAYHAVCSRCLVPTASDHRLVFDHTVVEDLAHQDPHQDGYVLLCDAVLDLGELAASDILLQLDGVNLCSDDCRGLCPICGNNRNEASCNCSDTQPDPRFDVLRAFLDQQQ